MATIGTNIFTMADLAKRMTPDQKDIAKIVEVLMAQNDLLKVMPFMEGNLPTGNRTTIRSGLPTVGTRRINQGVNLSKSTTKQVDEATMLLEAYSEVDLEQLRISANPAALRASEDVATVEAMNQYFAETLFYGNAAVDNDKFTGLATRYNSLSGEYGNLIIDAGGSGADNTSIWLVGLGERGLHGIYPMGTNAGIERTDMGEQLIQENNTRRTVKTTKHVWHNGISIKDYRHVIRIANIDVSDLATFGTGSDASAKLLNLMIQAMNKIPGNPTGYGLQYAFVMNETGKTWCDIMQTNKANGSFGLKEINGTEFTTFRGVPVIKQESITDAEAAVS